MSRVRVKSIVEGEEGHGASRALGRAGRAGHRRTKDVDEIAGGQDRLQPGPAQVQEDLLVRVAGLQTDHPLLWYYGMRDTTRNLAGPHTSSAKLRFENFQHHTAAGE